MKLKLLAFLAIWINIALTVRAQQPVAKIYGTVKDNDGKKIEYATVALYRAKDSVLVKSAFTEADGKFGFEQLANNTYLIRIAAMGYGSYKSAPLQMDASQQNIDLGDIRLSATANTLKEVNITQKKAFVERKIDRTVVNVDALISNAGTTALDVLSKSPGVLVDQDGGISLKGKKGVNVFIDDKPAYLSGADLENYLKSLPSSAIDQIELMTNPPAKYDAAGNAGVINIKTKKSKVVGFNGGLNLGLNQGELTRSNNSFNFNYRNNKINLFGNLSYNLNNSFTDLDLNRVYKNPDQSVKSFFNQNSYFKRHGNTFNLKTGLDFYASEQTTWGVVLSGMNRASNQVNNNTSNLFNPAMQPDSIIVARNVDDIHFKNGGVNLNMRHKFKKEGSELTFDADYIAYRNQTDQVYYNYSYFADRTLKSHDILSGNLPSNIDIYSLKTDYSYPLGKTWKLASGLKTSYTKTDNTADYRNTVNDVTTPDYNKSNHFLYKENINAAYLNMSNEGKRFSVQAGLRLENTVSDGHQLGNAMKPDSSFKRSYTSLFPTFYLTYKLDTSGHHQLGFNYGKRIDRPYYQDLNPFFSPLDKFTYYVGNPFLKPAYTQSIEISHSFKNMLTTTFSFSSIKDDVNETIEIVDGTYYSRPGNVGKKKILSLSMDGNFDLTKWLSIHAYAEFSNFRSKTDFYTGFLKTNGNLFAGNTNVQLKFTPTWSGELNYRYQSNFRDVQFDIGSLQEAGLAVQKKLSQKTTLKLAMNDIFRTRVFNGVINNLANTEANWRNRSDSRNVALSLSYRFGKNFSTKARSEQSGAESEKNRVKN
ncbi:TonB-dependent receptor [Pedobacter sp. ASV12]|uniref:TonB-dependent receptor n=1 Tax=Pedobacter sp. ASV12 TaxID=2795120 RepID=UPI0018EB31D8|nr:TonB-dependent receptor [Pedobacter sp. ASV12]